MPGGRALKPGRRPAERSGLTVEVNNTDAEGRLILGDALWYARQIGATHLVDVATLTGACVVALGKITTGLFGTPQPWVEAIKTAAAAGGEKVWQMPLFDDYKETLKSDIADIDQQPRTAGRCHHRGDVPQGVRRRRRMGAPRHRRHGLGRRGEVVDGARAPPAR